jgi:two-component sensor histidine kinase
MPNAFDTSAGSPSREMNGLLSEVASLGDDASIDNESLWKRLDVLPVPVLLTRDATAHDMRANLAGQRLFRADRQRNLSQSTVDPERPPFQVFSNDRLVPVDELPMQRAAATGKPVEQSECELRFDDGSSIFILGHCVPLFDKAGKVRASLGAFVDITDRKRLETENLLLTRELAHRAKNTITLIQSIASLSQRSVSSPMVSAAEW